LEAGKPKVEGLYLLNDFLLCRFHDSTGYYMMRRVGMSESSLL
jgi:hypothetical protein